MSYLDWKVGDKVVCVKVGEWGDIGGPYTNMTRAPEYGEVYTIAGFFKDNNDVFIWLDEFPGLDVFLIDRFRRVEPRKTDISCFTAMLTPAPKKERVS